MSNSMLAKYKNISLSLLLAVAAVSCTEVDFCDVGVHPHVAKVDVEYNWENVSEPTDSMVVIAYRVVNQWTCGYMSTPYTSGNTGRYIFNMLDTVEVAANGTAPLWVKCGDLRFLTYSYDKDNSAFRYSNYVKPLAITYNDLSVIYKPFDLGNALQGELATEWKEINDYTKYVPYNPEQVYYNYTKIKKISVKDNIVEFAPKSILKNYEFSFNISAQDVNITRIVAEVSGIPSSFKFAKEITSDSQTYKTLFPVEKEGSQYKANISVLGINVNKNPYVVKGNGILQLAIHTTSANGVSKVYNVMMNLYNTLYAQIAAERGGADPKNVKLDIAAPIVVTSSGVELPADDSALDKWVKM